VVDQHVGAAVLVQQLSASAARHERITVAVDTGKGEQPTAAGAVQIRDDGALGAQREAVRRVLDVAPSDHPAVVDKSGGSDGKLRVRHIRAPHEFDGSGSQRRPVGRRQVWR
jgi:hypothetical protein